MGKDKPFHQLASKWQTNTVWCVFIIIKKKGVGNIQMSKVQNGVLC
jgi:hypothetical protein